MKITAREKKFLTVGGCVVAAIVVFYLLALLLPSREGLSNDVEYKKKMLLKQREILRQEEMYLGRLEGYRQRLEQDMLRFLPGDNPNVAGAELQKILTDLAGQSGVEIMQKNVQREKEVQDNLLKVSVRIETNCLPQQLVSFLTALENYEKFLTVDELIINSFRRQKGYGIRPSITVSGYIVSGETKSEEANQ